MSRDTNALLYRIQVGICLGFERRQKAKELSGDDGAILFLLAMTHRNLGAENEAQSWLTQATKKRGEWTHARHGPSSSRASWGDVAKLNLLSREAEGVFALPIPEARGRR